MTTPPYRDAADDASNSYGYLALVLAWAVPGLGHFILGHKGRGIVFAVTIHGLFAAGLLLAGVRAINPPDQAIWSYTQFLTGWPMLVANYVEKEKVVELQKLQSEFNADRPSPDDEDRPERRQKRIQHAKDFIAQHPLFANHPKTQDIAAVYCGIAGMLNLLVMFDVFLRITGSSREKPEPKSPNPVPDKPQPLPTPGGA